MQRLSRLWQMVRNVVRNAYERMTGLIMSQKEKPYGKLRLGAFAGTLGLVLVTASVFLLQGKPLRPEINDLEQAPSFQTDELSIVQATPTGELEQISLSSEIVVVFNKPMVPLGVFRDREEAPIQITPSVSGKYRWHGSRVAAFVPDRELAPGTSYTVTVPASAKAVDGTTLQKKYTFEFSTPALKVEGRSPYRGKIDYKREFKIFFNAPVELSEAKRYIELLANGASQAVQMRHATATDAPHDYRINEDTYRRVIILKPARDLPRGASVSMIIKKGMKPAGGNIGLPETAKYEYETYGPLRAALRDKARFFQQAWDQGIDFNNPVKEADFQKHITIKPKVSYVHEGNSGTTSFASIHRWNVKPNTRYTITVSEALRDAYGNRLQGSRQFSLETPRLRKTVHLPGGVNHMETGGPGEIPVDVSGRESIQLEVGTFDLDAVLDYANRKGYSTRISTSVRKDLEWKTGMSKNQAGRVGFPIGKHQEDQTEWIALTVDDEVERYNGDTEEYTQTRFIQRTDLGIVTRAGSDGYHTWLHSLSTGAPVSGAEVRAYAGSGRIGPCETDSSGHCFVKESDHRDSRMLVFYAQHDEDRVFIMGKHHGVSLWSISPHYSSRAHLPSLQGQIVYDRKLYRPGETVQFAAFLAMWKNGKLVSQGSDLGSFQVTVSDATGKKIFEQYMKASREGGLNGSLDLPDKTPTGHYTIVVKSNQLDARKNGGDTVRDTFQVEEFKPVEFSVSWNKIPDAVNVEKTISGSLQGEYLFGAPMQNAKAKWRLSRKVINPHYQRKPDFFFGDEDYGDRWEPASYTNISEKDGELNARGQMDFRYRAERVKPEGLDSLDLSRSYKLEVEGAVTDINDLTLNGRTHVSVFAGPVLPGLHIKDRYKNSGESFDFELTAISSDGGAAPVSSAEVIIHKKEWKTIQSKSPGGTVQRRNTLQRKEVYRTSVSLSDDSLPLQYTPSEPGQYSITLRMIGSRAYTRMNFHAFGGGFIGWNFHNDDSITLVPDRREYSPGDTAKILVQSPFEKSVAIVTLERESVIWQKSFEITGNGQPIEIPIREDFVPNVYVSVMLVRPRVSQELQTVNLGGGRTQRIDLGRPKISMGVARLNVDISQRRIPLGIQTNRKAYGPGDPVRIDFKTEPGAVITLSVADRGVLDLINYRYRDPLAIFYNKRPHGVSVYDNRKSLIERMTYAAKGSEPGGKGWGEAARAGDGGFSEESEDGTRKDFRYTAYWEPVLKADDSGRAHIEFNLPHNLTTFRVQAVAAKKGRYNSAAHEFRVRKPVVVRPLAPRFIRPGDLLQIGALVTNQTREPIAMDVSMESGLLKLSGSGKERIELDAGESREVSFRAILNIKKYMKDKQQALAKLEESSTRTEDGRLDLEDMTISASTVETTIQAIAENGNEQLNDRMTFSFPVVESPPVEAFAVAGFTDESSGEGVKTPADSQVLEKMGYLELSLASTALTGLSQAFDFYRSNPYFCLEQRASAFLVRLAAGDLLSDFHHAPPDKKGYDFRRIESLFLDEMKSFQNSDGGFRPWKESSGYSSPYLTAYVVYVLQVARDSVKRGGASYDVDSSVYRKAVSYLKNYLKKPPRDYRGYVLETLSLVNYVLVKDGTSGSALESYLLERVDNLSLRARGYLALAIALRRGVADLEKDEDLKRLVNGFKNRMQFTANRISFNEDRGPYKRAYYSDGSLTGVLLEVFMAVEPGSPLIGDIVNQIMTDQANRYWSDSHSVGVLSHALFAFRHYYEKEEPDFDATVRLSAKNIMKTSFEGRSENRTFLRLPMADLQKIAPPGAVHKLEVKKKGQGRLYYRATLVYSPTTRDTSPVDNGIEVRREIIPVENPDATSQEAAVTAGPVVLKRGSVYLNRITVTVPAPVYDFLYRDPLASGIEPVNTEFQTESSGYGRFLRKQNRQQQMGDYYWRYSPKRQELRDDVVLITKDYLSPGVHEFFYLTRATVRGRMQLPPAEAFGMYEPYIFGRTGSSKLVIQ